MSGGKLTKKVMNHRINQPPGMSRHFLATGASQYLKMCSLYTKKRTPSTKEVMAASTSSARCSGVNRLYIFSPCRCSLAALFRTRHIAPRRPAPDANEPAAADEERRRHAGVAALLKELRLCSSGGGSTGSARARASNSVDCLLMAARPGGDTEREERSRRPAGSGCVGDGQARTSWESGGRRVL